MVPHESLVVLLLIPLVNGFNPLTGHRNIHAAESVRLLKANETVHPTGSDLVFSWVKCVICDGYDALLYLQDTSGTRVVPHQLKAAVTALKITNVPARTVYKFVVKRLPSDIYSSEVSGRTFSQTAPLPVEDLEARVLTASSIQIEWKSQSADGFTVQILRNGTVIQERMIPDFKNHSIVNITNLESETDYQVQVTAYYFPPAKNSISPVSSGHVKTLPVRLPRLHLEWRFDDELRLSWKNPESPRPVMHKLSCTGNSQPVLGTRLSGSTNFVAVTNVSDSTEIECVLETWFSVHDRSKVTTRVTALKTEQTNSTFIDTLPCDYNNHDIHTSVKYMVERSNGVETVVLTFSATKTHDHFNIKVQYRLCERSGACDFSWISLTKDEYSGVRLGLEKLKPWVPYTIQYRVEQTSDSYYQQYNGFTKIRSIELPGLVGPVDPVTQITATAEEVSWEYNSLSATPAYFLLTCCTENDCVSQNVPGDKRSVKLGKLRGNSVYYVTIQAVHLRAHRAYVSPTEMTSVIVPKLESTGNLTLTYTEIANSSTVQLHISHESTSAVPEVVAYHVAICSKPVPIWNDQGLASLLSSNASCETTVSTNSSIDLVREPWISYEIFVSACYAVFDSNEPVNVTLPVLKQNPSPLAGLSWTQETALLSWKYKTPLPSGFAISICTSRNEPDEPVACSDIQAGPLDRQYHVDASDLSDNGFTVFVTPFVTYGGLTYNGTRSELAVNLHGANLLKQA